MVLHSRCPAPLHRASPFARLNFLPFMCCLTSASRAFSSSPVSAQNSMFGRFLDRTMKGSYLLSPASISACLTSLAYFLPLQGRAQQLGKLPTAG
jgi:hypothetical protein